ncbi:DUF4221 family protein [Algoriphagus marinus]|uniref:DUF4221 family protein n=1 Tax=Algoriphagus marinus TaxID=1925762 RepID=UPI00094BA6C3|nr:DUF4221 family protein [Algoriphagus marinus]
MKKLLPILLLSILASCGGKGNSEKAGSKNILEDLTYSVDTLILDVGDEIFNPGSYYGRDLSEDLARLYFFYDPEKEIHEYDLANLKLVKIHPFESDGPNAIPSYINYFQALPKQEFFMADFAKAGIYSLEGKQIRNLRIQLENITGFDPEATFSLSNNIHLSPDKKKIISLPKNFEGPVEGLAVIDSETMNGTLKEISELELTDKYNVTFKQGNGMTRSGDFQTLQLVNNLFFIHSGATSDIYTYDWQTDSLRHHSFPHQLVAKSKTGDFPTEVDSHERRIEVMNEMRKQITFEDFYWDETRNLYFRLGSMGTEKDTKVFLFAYDEQLNLVGETRLKGMESMIYRTFLRNGKLYSYYVVEENPALVQFTFDF